MKGHTPTDIEPRLTRRAELRRSLEERRSELVAKLHERMRTMRAEHEIREIQGGLEDGEVSEVDIQEDIDLALIQMRAETLSRIDESIARLEAGVYGQCSSCGEEIATSRLRALPFAVRCRECEEHQETERRRARIDRGRAQPFFMDRNGLRDSALS
jgi:DnaK suppressor protein